MAQLDTETQELLTDADEVGLMIHGRGWAIVKAKLDAKILDLQNINNLDYEKPDSLSIQLAARKLASDLLFAWLKADVFGIVEQQQANRSKIIEKTETFIDRGDEAK